MTHQALSSRTVVSFILPIATAAFAIAIFSARVLYDPEIRFSVLYVAVVLMAARFCQARGVLLVSAGCACLTVLSVILSPPAEPEPTPLINSSIIILALGLTTFLVVRGQSAEAALRERANLLDLTHDAVFTRGMNGPITYWNRAAEELYGWKRAEALGRLSHQLLEKTFPAPLDEINTELLRTGRWEGELICKKRDGTQVVVASRWSLQRDKQGQPAAVLETNNDITERKRAQEALRDAQANLERLNRVTLVGEMTASIAHEVNQPIAAAATNASAGLRWLAAQPPDMDEARQSLGRIVRDAKRAGEVISRIRGLIRKVPARRDRLDINEAILEVIALTHSDLQRNRIKLETRLSTRLPLVRADRVQLQQVLLNLIGNAIEAMSEVDDRPRALAVASSGSASNDVLVEVGDSGPGLDPASLDHLFASFYTTKPDGMGMGLAISRSIVASHGGQLRAIPNQPYGAVFRFTLPIENESGPVLSPS
jgi:two-component system, LuxR family, sensor kinase FixL